MKKKIDDLGYSVRRLTFDDGCFKAVIVDLATGEAIVVRLTY
jgi:hypothetical protein